MKISRMKELVDFLRAASRAYYQEDREIISDFEYDRLYEELEGLEVETGVQLAGSPVAGVGYEAVEGLVKVGHELPLLSLDKTKDLGALVDFLGGEDGLLSWKLDGLTVVLSYEDGRLLRAVTRGNGLVGEDVSHNARCFVNVPLRIPYRERLLVRGEAVITYGDFDTINAAILDPAERYKNPRNLCSGTVRQLDSGAVAGRPVRYYAFAVLLQGDGPPNAGSKAAQLAFLSDMGFDVVEHRLTKAGSLPDDVDAFQKNLPALGIPTDGLVLSYDDVALSLSLGSTSKFPRDTLAFKWADELAETTLRRIEWNTSRTGLINPVAVFDPVEIEGSTVNKAGLHNVSILQQLALGEGDLISVYKANMIIPQIAENHTRSNTALVPEKCPVCQGKAELLKMREGEALYCTNPSCHAQLLGSLVHFCSRDAMNIEGLSEQTLEKFIERGLVSDYTDIFTLAQHESKIIKMEGFGQKSFDKLMASIERAKDVRLANFIHALGIKHVGLSNAKLLCKHFKEDIYAIQEKIQDSEELLSIKGFGEAIMQSLQHYFTEDKNQEQLSKAIKYLRFLPADEQEEGRLAGLTFVITGTVSHFPNRKALAAFIEKEGGKCASSVSAGTSYLINNDASSPSAKNKKAQSLGVPILTEEMFLDLCD